MITSRQPEAKGTVRTALILGLSLIAALLLLLIFDLVRSDRAQSVGMLVSNTWPHLTIVATLSLILFATAAALQSRGAQPGLTLRFQRAAWGLGFLFAAPVSVMMVEQCVYNPIKFSCLIWRVENARTAEQEAEAFRLAGRWGRVWELNPISKREYLPAHAHHIEGGPILELEWLESWPAGKPFRAYRRVIDERNLKLLSGARTPD